MLWTQAASLAASRAWTRLAADSLSLLGEHGAGRRSAVGLVGATATPIARASARATSTAGRSWPSVPSSIVPDRRLTGALLDGIGWVWVALGLGTQPQSWRGARSSTCAACSAREDVRALAAASLGASAVDRKMTTLVARRRTWPRSTCCRSARPPRWRVAASPVSLSLDLLQRRAARRPRAVRGRRQCLCHGAHAGAGRLRQQRASVFVGDQRAPAPSPSASRADWSPGRGANPLDGPRRRAPLRA